MFAKLEIWDDWNYRLESVTKPRMYELYLNLYHIQTMGVHDSRLRPDGMTENIYFIRYGHTSITTIFTHDSPEEIIRKGTMDARPLPAVYT